jgi:protein TonB
MEVKKSPKANLENYRGTFMLIGVVIALIVVYFVFGISKANVKIQDLKGSTNNNVEEEQVAITRQDVTPPPPPPPQKQVSNVIDIVSDNVKISDNFDFNTEATDSSTVQFGDVNFDQDEGDDADEKPVVWAEQMPQFPGGEAALRQYIAEHIEYPELAAENDIQGTVYIRFVVTKKGTVGKVQVQRGVDPLLDKEAVRVVKTLPRFKPGRQGGRAVPVWYSIPIVFKLSN